MTTKRDTSTPLRKADHIDINFNQDVQSGLTNGLENYAFLHQALPEVNLSDVDLRQTLFSKTLSAPFLISSMTGGTEDTGKYNRLFASVAQETGIAFGVGSQRAALEQPSLETTFQIRKFAPDILLFANLGAVQLNLGYGVDACKRVVDMIEADALILHLNPLQEALQPEGNTQFRGLLAKIEDVCKTLPVPVVIKEVGWGISGRVAKMLADVGVKVIDVAGAGGTSWSQVEMYRNIDSDKASIAANFHGWGIPTADSIRYVRENAPNMLIFASGGLSNGIEVAKCLALGAKLGGMAGPLLMAAKISDEKLLSRIRGIIEEIRLCLFVTGKSTLVEFDESVLVSKKAISHHG